MSTNLIDILGITETHLSVDLPDILIPLYTQYHVFRKDLNRYGGGICLLIKKDLPGVHISRLDIPTEFNRVEILAVDIADRNMTLSLRVIVCYRPRGYDTESNLLLSKALESASSGCASVLLWVI